jgi:hypothetical protein
MLQLLPDGTLDGWCWSPGRPDERLLIEILDGDAIAISLVADRFRDDLPARGIGDGRHGFQTRLPDHPPGAGGRLIHARERVSGVVFASLRNEMAGRHSSGIERLDRATVELAALQSDIAALRGRIDRHRRGSRPAAALHQMSVMLSARTWIAPESDLRSAAFAVAAASEELRRRFPPLTLPPCTQEVPFASIVLLAAPDIAHTMEALRALAGLSHPGGVEIVLANDGREPRTALLHTLVNRLRVASPPARAHGPARGEVASDAARAAVAIGQAVALSRGACLVVLAAGSNPLSAASAAALLKLMEAHPNHVLPGGLGRTSLARWGLAAPDRAAIDAAGGDQNDDAEDLVMTLHGSIGLVVALRRALWTEIGGLDPAVADGAGLECADAALKAWLIGSPIGRVTEPWGHAPENGGPLPDGPLAPPDAAWQASAVFRARWGDLGLEQETHR